MRRVIPFAIVYLAIAGCNKNGGAPPQLAVFELTEDMLLQPNKDVNYGFKPKSTTTEVEVKLTSEQAYAMPYDGDWPGGEQPATSVEGTTSFGFKIMRNNIVIAAAAAKPSLHKADLLAVPVEGRDGKDKKDPPPRLGRLSVQYPAPLNLSVKFLPGDTSDHRIVLEGGRGFRKYKIVVLQP